MTVEWPTLALGVLFVLAAGFFVFVGPAQYQALRQLPKWMLPISRLWPERFDVWLTRLLAAAIATFGVALTAAAFFA